MRIPRVYAPELDPSAGALIQIDARASHHLRTVLRMQPGARVRLFCGQGWDVEAELIDVPRRGPVRARTIARRPVENESPLPVTLYQAVSRGERMDLTIQKAVELGVARIVPLWTARSAKRLSDARLQRRLAHWRGVIIAACEQCGRARLPELGEPTELSTLKASRGRDTLPLLLDPQGEGLLRSRGATPSRVVLVSGPEGGLTPQERAKLVEAGFLALRLGPRILRTETAALAALSAVQTLWGDLGHRIMDAPNAMT